jgi:hypothetical protein
MHKSINYLKLYSVIIMGQKKYVDSTEQLVTEIVVRTYNDQPDSIVSWDLKFFVRPEILWS